MQCVQGWYTCRSALFQHRQHACTATSIALIINLEDLVVKQACEQARHEPKVLWLAKD